MVRSSAAEAAAFAALKIAAERTIAPKTSAEKKKESKAARGAVALLARDTKAAQRVAVAAAVGDGDDLDEKDHDALDPGFTRRKEPPQKAKVAKPAKPAKGTMQLAVDRAIAAAKLTGKRKVTEDLASAPEDKRKSRNWTSDAHEG